MTLCKFILISLWLLFALNSCNQSDTEKESAAGETIQADQQTKPLILTASLPEWPQKPGREKEKCYPFDAAGEQQDFKAFRDTFYQYVVDKNTKALLASTTDNLKMDFGDLNGKSAFITTWGLDTAASESRLWKELATVLELGGGWDQHTSSTFMAPWLFVEENINDPYTDGVVVGKGVRIRQSPESSGKVLGNLTYDRVEVNYNDPLLKTEVIDGETHQWVKVKTASGVDGYVYGKYVRLPIDYRALFQKVDGRWKMISFIAGD